ncbi:MAG: hypothetical protein Q8O07_07505, partial [Chloroflexota bacterium]|nr:hypothetical protein [Chloroflexota bacterium]
LASTPAVGLRGAFLLNALLILIGWLLIRRLTRPARKLPTPATPNAAGACTLAASHSEPDRIGPG